MGNHWHLVLWPEGDGDRSRFMFWLTMTHTQRWRHARHLVGLGPLYQGRFKAFVTETDHHYLTLCRYVERNPLRAGLVKRAEQWRWCSLAVRLGADSPCAPLLRPWPLEAPRDWLRRVNQPQSDAEVAALRVHIRTGRPFGNSLWQRRTAERLGIDLDPRPRGRPRKHGNK
jgi:putative transposase